MTEHDLRIGDVERDETAAVLANHFAAGRLTRAELDERMGKALGARTRREVDQVVVDLPSTSGDMHNSATVGPAGDVAACPRKAPALWRRGMLAPWAVFSVFFVVLWAVTGAGYFWPVWPVMGWGIGVAMSGIAAHGHPASLHAKRHQHRSGPLVELRQAPYLLFPPITHSSQHQNGEKES